MAAVIPAADIEPEKGSPEYGVDADVSSPPATCGPSTQIRAILFIVSFTLSVILAWREAVRETTTEYQYYSDDVYYDQNDRAWNTCQNGGSTAIDPAGGNICICASGFGGMNCQFGTASLDAFHIDLGFDGNWTAELKGVVQSAAERWSNIITHVPCGGSNVHPGGHLVINASLSLTDGVGGVICQAYPATVWFQCPLIPGVGVMEFDIDDIEKLEQLGLLESVVLHEMGHAIGIGTLWAWTSCSTCLSDGDVAWTCPAANSTFFDLGGTHADILEPDGGAACGHFNEDIFDDEIMTGYLNSGINYLSKMTAAVLEDAGYIVDPSEVDLYILPQNRAESTSTGASVEQLPALQDMVMNNTMLVVDSDGSVVGEREGIMMVLIPHD